MTRAEEARKLTDDAKELVLLAGRTWTAYAAICNRMKEEKLYREIGFETFGEWCKEVGDKSASQSYEMADVYANLKETIPEEAIAQLTISNARDLTKIPAKKRTAKLVEMGTKLTNNQFRQEINKTVPNLALEQTCFKGFQLDKSAADVVNKAIELAKKNEDLAGDPMALEAICQSYLASEGQDEHYKAAKALVTVIEEQINPEQASAPPDKRGWASVLVTSRRLARVFGFSERRVMPAPTPTTEPARARVN